MSNLEKTPIKDTILDNQEIINANRKLLEEYLPYKPLLKPLTEPLIKPTKPESPFELFDFGTGDEMLGNEYRQYVNFKNGDHLDIRRNGGKITSLTDKNFNKIDIPGDGKNLAPADAPTEMYRLSNGALYIKDKSTGEQTLINDGSSIVIDSEGIREFKRGNQCTVFARERKSGLEYLKDNPLPGGVLLK